MKTFKGHRGFRRKMSTARIRNSKIGLNRRIEWSPGSVLWCAPEVFGEKKLRFFLDV
jgi:hypothetical protein